jgi:hypothetical protein
MEGTMRLALLAAVLLSAPLALADENGPAQDSCTTTTTTTTRCTGSAAPLAAPGPELAQQPAPQPAPAPYYAPPPGYYPGPGYVAPQPYFMPPPVKTHIEQRPMWGLVGAGLGVFGGVYFWNVLAASLASDWRPAIPIVGPFLLMGDRDLKDLQGLLALDGILQGAGAVMILVGAVMKKNVTVYDKVSIVPAVNANGAGLAAMGQF